MTVYLFEQEITPFEADVLHGCVVSFRHELDRLKRVARGIESRGRTRYSLSYLLRRAYRCSEPSEIARHAAPVARHPARNPGIESDFIHLAGADAGWIKRDIFNVKLPGDILVSFPVHRTRIIPMDLNHWPGRNPMARRYCWLHLTHNPNKKLVLHACNPSHSAIKSSEAIAERHSVRTSAWTPYAVLPGQWVRARKILSRTMLQYAKFLTDMNAPIPLIGAKISRMDVKLSFDTGDFEDVLKAGHPETVAMAASIVRAYMLHYGMDLSEAHRAFREGRAFFPLRALAWDERNGRRPIYHRFKLARPVEHLISSDDCENSAWGAALVLLGAAASLSGHDASLEEACGRGVRIKVFPELESAAQAVPIPVSVRNRLKHLIELGGLFAFQRNIRTPESAVWSALEMINRLTVPMTIFRTRKPVDPYSTHHLSLG